MSRPQPKPELRTWLDDLFGLFARVLGAVNRRNAEFLQGAVRLMAPYAVRSLSRRKLRGAMLAASIALALVSFVVYSSYYNATRTRLEGRVVPLELGTGLDAIAVKSYTSLEVFARGVETNPSVLALGTAEPAVLETLDTSLGSSRFWGFVNDGLAGAAVTLTEGRFPQSVGEVAVPGSWIEQRQASVGSAIDLAYLDAQTGVWRRQAGVVVGVVEDGSFVAHYPITTITTLEQLRGIEGANALLLHWSAGTTPGRAASRLQGIARAEQVLTPNTPRQRAAALVGGLFSPVRLILFIVFGFSALGVLNVMLLSFLQRRRQFGILKATGAEDRELQVLLLLEGFLMALGGIVSGVLVAAVVTFVLNRYTAERYVLDPLALVGGMVLSVAVFYVGALLPVNMLRTATVDELLRNRRLL